jgi:Protein kinase domain/WD40-like Beta Propeller Repeat
LKPANIMLTKASSKLLDFGLAKLREDAASATPLSQLPTGKDPITAQGTILGTLQYMAPEQLEGKEADARTDIFAFGVVVYEMATGKKAFEGKSQASLRQFWSENLRRSDGRRAKRPEEDNLDKVPVSWSPDGRFILYRTTNAAASGLFVFPLSGDRKPYPFLKTQFNEGLGQFSPDGRWLAYVANESGGREIYVQPYPGPVGGKWQISTAGGYGPRWRRDGTEIFYLAPDNKLVAAAVGGKGRSFEVGTVTTLFQTHVISQIRTQYAVTADGQRFLVNTISQQATSSPITVVVNWTAGLKK